MTAIAFIALAGLIIPAIAAAATAKLTPAAENWASVEGARILEDFFIGVASGGDVAQLAADADKAITETLN